MANRSSFLAPWEREQRRRSRTSGSRPSCVRRSRRDHMWQRPGASSLNAFQGHARQAPARSSQRLGQAAGSQFVNIVAGPKCQSTAHRPAVRRNHAYRHFFVGRWRSRKRSEGRNGKPARPLTRANALGEASKPVRLSQPTVTARRAAGRMRLPPPAGHACARGKRRRGRTGR
jgi:hypothetical protein